MRYKTDMQGNAEMYEFLRILVYTDQRQYCAASLIAYLTATDP